MKEKVQKIQVKAVLFTKKATVVVGLVVLGMMVVRAWDFSQYMGRKWNALQWVMSDYNEEIVEKHMSTQKAELQLVITKK